ncbi:MAG: hypothetical protein Q8N17_26135 [Burkholderiaceae bacterium]|nr:hypothetical protein [Burkholderiaceae bacterium]
MLTTDEKLHLYGGIAIALVLAAMLLAMPHIGPGFALAFGSVVFGAGVEWYQHIRREGDADILDAMFSSLPGVFVGVAWAAVE